MLRAKIFPGEQSVLIQPQKSSPRNACKDDHTQGRWSKESGLVSVFLAFFPLTLSYTEPAPGIL